MLPSQSNRIDQNDLTETIQNEATGEEWHGRKQRFQSIIEAHGVLPETLTLKQRLQLYVKEKWTELSCLYLLNACFEKIPFIRCIKEYKVKKYLIGDIIAGITVAVMHIPQGIAYGVLAGLSASYGLYVSFFPVLIYMIFGTCPHLSMGTFAIISLMTAKALDEVKFLSSVSNSTQSTLLNSSNISNLTESDLLIQKAGVATTLAFFVGLIQLILSFLRLGFITVYLSEPFINGFTTGAAVHVFSSQVPTAFGVSSPKDIQGAFKLPRFYYQVIGSIFGKINWITTAISAASILLLYVAKKLNERYKSKIRIVLPFELILVVISTVVSYLVKLNTNHKVAVVGTIKRGLPAPKPPPFQNISDIFVSAITISAVSLCLNIAMAKTFSRKHGYKVSSNQELLAYGLANSVSSFFQCFPCSASLSRCVLQDSSGGKTMITSGISSIIILIVIAAIAPLFEPLPMACLSAIIIVSLKGLLLQVKDFLMYFHISIFESILWMVTFLSTVLFDVDIGLYAGVATSFILNTIRTQKPRFTVLGRIPNTNFYKSVHIFPSAEQNPKIKIIRFDGSLYASNFAFFKRKLYELIGLKIEQTPIIKYRKPETTNINEFQIKYVILDCSPFNFIDTVGVKTLIEVYKDLKKRNITLFLSECRYDIRLTFERMSFDDKIEARIIYASTDDAMINALFELEHPPTISQNMTSF